MPIEILALSPLPPFIASFLIGAGMFGGRIEGEPGERLTVRIALGAALLSALLVGAGLVAKFQGRLPDQLTLGVWLHSGDYTINLSFSLDGLSLMMATLIAVLSILVLRFSVNYMHRETGFHRFFVVLSLFIGAMLLLATAGNAAMAFIAWELAGVSSYLLISYAYDRPVAAANATRAFVTNRVGDAGFILGIFLAFYWTGGIDWPIIFSHASRLAEWQAGVLACCFLLAAAAKSAQVPFAPWLARAMEGPTPSSAIFYGALMIHAGVYLVLRLAPVFEHAPVAMALMAALGLLTAVYGFACGLIQTDVKSALIFSTSAQVGLMFVAAGLGFWELARWHLCAHAVFRGYQFLAAPSLMQQVAGSRTRPVPLPLARSGWLSVAVLQRFWLENLGDWLAVKPVQRLGEDFQWIDRQVIDNAFGLPAPKPGTLSSLADLERRDDALPKPDREITRVSGVAGSVVRRFADAMYWFERRLVLQGNGEKILAAARRMGQRLNRFESILSRPRYLAVLIIATLLAAF